MDLKITVFGFSLFFKNECEYIVAEFWKLWPWGIQIFESPLDSRKIKPVDLMGDTP